MNADTRASDRRAFNIECLQDDIRRHAAVLARILESSERPPARFSPESEGQYERRCLSRKVSLECEASREREQMASKRRTLADVYGVEVKP